MRVWSAKTGRSPETWLETTGWIWSVGWNRDGRLLAVTGDKEVIVRDNAGAVRQIAKPSGQFSGGTWAGSRSRYAFIDDVRVVVVNASTQETVMERPVDGHMFGVALASDGDLVAISSRAEVMVLSVPSGELRWRVEAFSPALAFSPDSQFLAFAPVSETSVEIVDASKGKHYLSLAGLSSQGKASWAMAWSPDGRYLATGSDDHITRVWNLSSPDKPWLLIRGHDRDVKGVAWNMAGDRLATASLDGTVRMWEMPSGRPGGVLTGHASGVRAVAWSKDGKTIVSGSEDGTSRLFRADFNGILALARQQEEIGLTAPERDQCSSRIALDAPSVQRGAAPSR